MFGRLQGKHFAESWHRLRVFRIRAPRMTRAGVVFQAKRNERSGFGIKRKDDREPLASSFGKLAICATKRVKHSFGGPRGTENCDVGSRRCPVRQTFPHGADLRRKGQPGGGGWPAFPHLRLQESSRNAKELPFGSSFASAVEAGCWESIGVVSPCS